jgi:sugar phosphate permease
MKLPPPFFERPFWLQVAGGIVVPMVFGILSGFALGWNEILYIVMAGPIAILGGFLAGVEHRETDEGVLRGVIGGLVYGSFILIGHEIMNNEPKADLPDPQGTLAVVTARGGAILGGLGARYRRRQERRLDAAPLAR